ncbi:MAG: pyridoxal-dependent decarboxylase [Bacteroidetes bacterium]|nr:pyridoxal-dependent decarboxylase [Bacteroidota bacterium]
MTKDLLKKAYDAEHFREEGHKLVDLIADYLSKCNNNPDFKVMPWMEPMDQYQDWKDYMHKDDDILSFYKKFLDHANHLHHPKYIGHQVVPPLPVAALSDLMATFSNNGMAIYEMGPASTAIERNVIEWLLDFVGWNGNSNGLITSGGSLGNLTALLAARQNFPEYDIWENGVKSELAVMVSAESHYSVERSIRIMGLGSESIIKLPVIDHRIDSNLLEDELVKAKENGKKVFALIGNACSTSTGTYDDIDALADFCNKHKIWFHIDGAHGGAAIISEKYKHLINGVQKADSVVIDFHKMMLTPALTTAVLFKDGNKSYESFSQKAAYLLDKKGEIKWYDGAGRTVECTKKAMGLKVYQMIKFYGRELFESYLDTTYDLAKEFAKYIEEIDDFELATQPDANIVCFRVNNGQNEDELNAMNASIRAKLLKDGEFYIVQTNVDDKVYLRITIMNPFTTLDTLKELVEKIKTIN